MRSALVTGASGFVGRVLCALLQQRGVAVRALQRRCCDGPWDDCHSVDLLTQRPGERSLDGIDTVFHLAGRAHAEGDDVAGAVHRAISVMGTRHLLDVCRGVVERVVFASSVKAMCETTPASCVDENAVPRPVSAYGRSRLEAEKLVLEAAPSMHCAVIRLPLVYGPGVRGNLEALLRAVIRYRLPLFPEFENKRSLVHVEDACAALIAAASTGRACGRVYLVTDGETYSTRRIQELIYAASGRQPPRFSVPDSLLVFAACVGDALRAVGVGAVPMDSQRLSQLRGHACFDCSRARSEIGFVPCHRLETALPAMLAVHDSGVR